ncbi:MAG: hypothetical protein EHM70_10865 [Chloroflexota bacterium]|nr:MAG: hypothetical protein EHM70_10865 [Chloroflexota bacterium]
MLQPRYLPNPDRLSVLAATILLAYALTRFVDLPARDFAIQLPGVFLAFQVNFRTVVALLAAGLTASGADWLLRDHPALGDHSTFQHWLLPALTAWVIGVPLFLLPFGILWWVIFAIGGSLLMLVLVAEYIVVDPEDIRYPPAAAMLTAVSFVLFLVLAIVLRSAGLRLYLILPAVIAAGGLVSLRTLRLRLPGSWRGWEALVIALVVGQLSAALHYWPLSPVAYGLALLGPVYALTGLLRGLAEGETLRQAILEPGLVLCVVWVVAIWMR